jgi:hypothetical protein
MEYTYAIYLNEITLIEINFEKCNIAKFLLHMHAIIDKITLLAN